ncbi:MAG: HEAT repeat domain-containing protein [Chloroflexota bacterium]
MERAAVLRDRVNGHPENVDAVLPELVQMLHAESDASALAAIIEAVGSAWDERGVAAVLAFADHPAEGVRLAVAQAIPGGADSEETVGAAIQILIVLMEDAVADIRDYATFGLGSMLREQDSPAIRDALRRRLTDSHRDTRHEALVGLAQRHDPSVLPYVRSALREDSVSRLGVAAAGALADRRLLGDLLRIRPWWDVDVDLLERAIAACEAQDPGDIPWP